MYSFKIHASKVAVYESTDGWVRADYSGPLSAKTFVSLGELVCRNLVGATGVIERLDLAVTLFSGSDCCLEDLSHLKGTPPGVWVVGADQYMGMLDLAQLARQIGVTRYVVLPHQLAQVADFVRFETAQ